MKIRIKVNQPVDRSPCAHRDLTLAGRFLRLQGLHLKRSTERYTCNACGIPLVRTLKMSVSYLLPPIIKPLRQVHSTPEIDPAANRLVTSTPSAKQATTAPPPIYQTRLEG
jgi:hypothetical protein